VRLLPHDERTVLTLDLHAADVVSRHAVLLGAGHQQAVRHVGGCFGERRGLVLAVADAATIGGAAQS
jgi:hypothetical protein